MGDTIKEEQVELSIIIPYVVEFPQIAFTVNSIFCEFRDRVNFEIIVIDNWCNEAAKQTKKVKIHNLKDLEPKEIESYRVQDSGSKYMEDIARERPWLKYIKYEKKLSHWQAKNAGVAESKGKFLWFCDSHCILSRDSIYNMFQYYKEHYEELNGTLHSPLSYMLEQSGRELIYKLVLDEDRGVVHYSFSRYQNLIEPFIKAGKPIPPTFKVPCMSTCGMMMTRELYDQLGGWPTELGIYGGGENFINFTLAVLGKTINIYPTNPLYHYADKRGYNWNYTDYHRNRAIATYMFGDKQWADKYIHNIKGRPEVLDFIYKDITTNPACVKQRIHISGQQQMTIDEWVAKQKEK